MSSSRPEPSETPSATLNFDVSDIANTGPFIDALVDFLNEALICMQEVKNRAGFSPGCNSPVTMNDEEKQDKLSTILGALSKKCNLEISKSESSDNESESAPVPSCYCPPGKAAHSSRPMPKSRPAIMPRPGTSGSLHPQRVPPDNFLMPVTQSNLGRPPAGFSQQGRPCPLYSGSSAVPKGRSSPPYSSLIGSGGNPRAYLSAPGPSGRGANSYPPRSFGGTGRCPPQCAESISGAGRQDPRRLRGQDPGAF